MMDHLTSATAPVTAPSWSDDVDGVFFRVTAAIFSPAFTLGASVLLASYDGE